MKGPHKVLAAVIRRDGRYLLGRRPAHKPLGSLWEFPGGKVEPGESLGDAARRELREELDLELSGLGDTLLEVIDPTGRYLVCFVEIAVADGQEPRNLEHDELAWVALDELSALELAPSDRSFVDQLAMHGSTARPTALDSTARPDAEGATPPPPVNGGQTERPDR